MKGMVVLTVKPSVIHIIYKVTDRILFRYQNHRNDVNVNLRLYIETQHTCKIQINRDQQAQCYQDHFSVDNKFPVCSHMRIVVFLYICDEVQRIFIHDGRILSNCAVQVWIVGHIGFFVVATVPFSVIACKIYIDFNFVACRISSKINMSQRSIQILDLDQMIINNIFDKQGHAIFIILKLHEGRHVYILVLTLI